MTENINQAVDLISKASDLLAKCPATDHPAWDDTLQALSMVECQIIALAEG